MKDEETKEMKNAYIKYLISLVLFGSNAIAASALTLSSVEIIFFRTLIGSIFLFVVFLFSKRKMMFWRAGRQSLYIVASGIAMGASWVFLFEAYQHIGVCVAMLAYYTGPLLVMVAATVIFKERLTVPKIIGLTAVVVGMFCVNGIAILEEGLSWGLFCGLMAAVLYTVVVICNKKATKITGIENSLCQLIVSCITVGLFMLFTHSGGISIAPDDITPLLYLGVVGTGLACSLYFSSIQTLSTQTVSVCGYLEPLSALVLSAAFLGERMTLIQLIGAFLILAGAASGELFSGKKLVLRRRQNKARMSVGE